MQSESGEGRCEYTHKVSDLWPLSKGCACRLHTALHYFPAQISYHQKPRSPKIQTSINHLFLPASQHDNLHSSYHFDSPITTLPSPHQKHATLLARSFQKLPPLCQQDNFGTRHSPCIFKNGVSKLKSRKSSLFVLWRQSASS